jgi:hypothetical protein
MLIETIDPTSSSVVINEKVVTVTLTDWLEYEASYYVIVEKGAFTNTSQSKLPFDGITTTQGWNFSVKKQVCDTMDIMVTVMDEMECSAMVNIEVDSKVETVLTLNGDTIMTGDTTLASGMYTAIVYNVDGDCSETKEFTIGSMPVVMNDTVYTIISGQVDYINEEAGIDTMLTIGDHTFMYDYMGCERTLNVAVIKIIGTPTIKEIQGETDESPLVGEVVFCVGTVSAVAPGEGFFMQDANEAWSGIWVEFSDATYEGLQIGNGVIVRGEVAEVANVTSLVDIKMSFLPPSLLNVEPIMVSPSEVDAEMYESVLVKVAGARTTAVNASGEWTIYYEESDNAVVNDWLYTATVVEDKYYDVTGVVNGRLDYFRIEPRMVLDVKNLDITGVNPIEVDGFSVYPNPFNDKITIDNYDKLTRVVVSNIAGQRVIDIEYPTREIRTANLVSGIYVISLYTENGVAKTERMIKR